MGLRIAPSILAGDWSDLGREVERAEQAGADWIHVDVMDGHFVDNLTVGPPVVSALRRRTKLPLDVHLMIENPEKLVPAFLDAGADWVTFHAEAVAHPRSRRRAEMGWTLELLDEPPVDKEKAHRLIETIRAAGRKASMAINPDTMVEALEDLPAILDMVLVMTVWPGFGGQRYLEGCEEKVRRLRSHYPALSIEVDGGIDGGTIGGAARAGADVFVAGTATFRAPDMGRAIRALRERAMAGEG